ncbi:hypothetical protein, partial [Pseudomonas fulva]|uniref:hypothetical protein n=1 Tax=Pseudomonas fulva TaxID=47880 RepID=UPI002B1E4849
YNTLEFPYGSGANIRTVRIKIDATDRFIKNARKRLRQLRTPSCIPTTFIHIEKHFAEGFSIQNPCSKLEISPQEAQSVLLSDGVSSF